MARGIFTCKVVNDDCGYTGLKKCSTCMYRIPDKDMGEEDGFIQAWI